MNTAGSSPTALTNTAGNNFAAAWSPDGSKIAFTSTRDGGNLEIYVMNADGSNQTRLTNDAERDFDPTWAPDGSKIAFSHGGEVGSDIYVMNASGSGVTNLTESPTYADVTAAWSPDGTRIAFVSDRDGNSEIYVMNADGSNETNISNNPASETLPDWQPQPAEPVCVFGPTLYTRAKGPPANHVEQFTATPGTYIVDLDGLGSMGADATVKLNGVVIMEGRGTTGEVGPRHYMVSVTLSANNVLEINLRGKKGSVLQVKICPASASQCYPDLPAPELVLQSTTVDGNSVHSALDVPNYAQFPDALFAPAPDLEPCGLQTGAPRTWVDIYDGNGNFVHGFCSLAQASDLNDIVLTTAVDQWPAEVYIVMTDRRCNITYTSNRINLASIL
jgi:dipeptidyl aminopeptidase/acylaminoacyl peptidase